jgi:hypothetical protein
MTYPSEWLASSDPSDERGTATFVVEGIKYTFRLESFKAYGSVAAMLEAVFKQGKVFAAGAMRGHIQRSLDEAEREHDLS